jgi:hypothetical protein
MLLIAAPVTPVALPRFSYENALAEPPSDRRSLMIAVTRSGNTRQSDPSTGTADGVLDDSLIPSLRGRSKENGMSRSCY